MGCEGSSMHVIEIDFCDPPAAAYALRDLPCLNFLDVSLGRYELVVVFDCIELRGFILSAGFPGMEWPARHRRAIERGRWFETRLRSAPVVPPAGNTQLEGWTSNFTKVSYEQMVR